MRLQASRQKQIHSGLDLVWLRAFKAASAEDYGTLPLIPIRTAITVCPKFASMIGRKREVFRCARYNSVIMTNGSSLPKLREQVMQRITSRPGIVWTPGDFADLASRDAVDKTLQRLAKSENLRRIDRGLYDRPARNMLTSRMTVPDYRAVIDAITRRNQVRYVIDGMTAANELGLTTAVPAKVEVLVDARLRPVTLGKQKIVFKCAAPSRLYWAGRAGMAIVQALHWLKDVMDNQEEMKKIQSKLLARLRAKPNGPKLVADLKYGLNAMPIWMQEFLRTLIAEADQRISDGN